MTVSSSVNKVTYSGNSATLIFPVNYYFLENSHLQVILVSNNVETIQTLTSQYTVTGAGNPAGGSVTMVTAPPTGTQLIIVRNVPATQETDYLANDPFPAESHERALDKLTMLVQQVELDADRALKIPLSSLATTSTELPAPSANKLLAWNSNASAVTNLDPASVISVVGQQASFSNVFTGNGVTVNFTLDRTPGNVNAVDVSVNGVTQVPNVDYILNGNILTFTTAPPQVASQILARYTEVFTETDGDAANVRYMPAGTGAVVTNVQAKLRETVSVKDFGAVGDGVVDDTSAFENAINKLTQQNGGILFIQPGVYNISTPLLIENSNIVIQGAGGDSIHDGGNTATAATKIVWVGSLNTTSIFTFQTPQGVNNSKINNCGLNNIYLQCNGLINGLNIKSVNKSTFQNLTIVSPLAIGLQVTNYIAGQIADAADSQNNLFVQINVRTIEGPLNAWAYHLTSETPFTAGANTSFNTFMYCDCQVVNGYGWLLSDADNNNLISCRAFVLGTGRGLEFRGFADYNSFYNFSSGGFPSQIYVLGTASGFPYDSNNNVFLFPDQANGTTYPYTDLGCSVFWLGQDGITIQGTSTKQVIAQSNAQALLAKQDIGNASLIVWNESEAGFLLTDGTNEWAFNQTGANGNLRIIGATAASTFNCSNDMNLGGNVAFPGIPTSASAANAFLDSADNNKLYRSVSSAKYKTEIETLEPQYSDALLNARPVWYRSLCDGDNKDWSWFGLIAEELAQIEPRLVHWSYADDCYEIVEVTEQNGSITTTKVLKPNAKLTPESVQYDRLSVLLLDKVKRQQKQIDDFEIRLSKLEKLNKQ
jgi:hypothetical protein